MSLFNSKDLKTLETLLAKGVTLNDWEYNIVGRDKVIDLADKTFKQFPELKIKVADLQCGENNAYAELIIELSSDLKLFVVDILKITNGKISEIKAYRR